MFHLENVETFTSNVGTQSVHYVPWFSYLKKGFLLTCFTSYLVASFFSFPLVYNRAWLLPLSNDQPSATSKTSVCSSVTVTTKVIPNTCPISNLVHFKIRIYWAILWKIKNLGGLSTCIGSAFRHNSHQDILKPYYKFFFMSWFLTANNGLLVSIGEIGRHEKNYVTRFLVPSQRVFYILLLPLFRVT